MQLHQIRPIHKRKTKKRLGRGGKRGTFCGRGVKGQKARAGARIRPAWRDLIKRMPKKRGAYFKPRKQKLAVINLKKINIFFKEDLVVSPKELLVRGLIGKIKGKIPAVKILGKGELTKKLTFKDCQVSQGAKEKIERAGGEIIATKYEKPTKVRKKLK